MDFYGPDFLTESMRDDLAAYASTPTGRNEILGRQEAYVKEVERLSLAASLATGPIDKQTHEDAKQRALHSEVVLGAAVIQGDEMREVANITKKTAQATMGKVLQFPTREDAIQPILEKAVDSVNAMSPDGGIDTRVDNDLARAVFDGLRAETISARGWNQPLSDDQNDEADRYAANRLQQALEAEAITQEAENETAMREEVRWIRFGEPAAKLAVATVAHAIASNGIRGNGEPVSVFTARKVYEQLVQEEAEKLAGQAGRQLTEEERARAHKTAAENLPEAFARRVLDSDNDLSAVIR